MIDPTPLQYYFTFLAAVIWGGTWKLIALWHAGKNKQKAWFVCLGIFNTLGLLTIGYLLWGQKDKNGKK